MIRKLDIAKIRDINASQLELILKNKIFNTKAYGETFFVANGMAYHKRLEELGDYEQKLESCPWYAKFSCNGHSHIILPGEYSIYLNTANRQIRIAEPACFFHDSDDEKMLFGTGIRPDSLIKAVARQYPTLQSMLA